jgi:hypothetical protein
MNRVLPDESGFPGRTWCAVDANDPALNRQVRGSSPWRRTFENRPIAAGSRRFPVSRRSVEDAAGASRYPSAAYRRGALPAVGASERQKAGGSGTTGYGLDAARHYRVVVERHLIPELGNRNVGALSVRELDAFASRKLAAGYAPATQTGCARPRARRCPPPSGRTG